MISLLVGFMSAAWLFTILVGVYAVWRYVKTPWIVMRKDIVMLHDTINALAGQVQSIENDIGLRRVGVLTDEQAAVTERRLKMRKLLSDTTA